MVAKFISWIIALALNQKKTSFMHWNSVKYGIAKFQESKYNSMTSQPVLVKTKERSVECLQGYDNRTGYDKIVMK